MRDAEENNKLLDGLKKIRDKVAASDKEAIEYKIHELEVEKERQGELSFDFDVPKHLLEEKYELTVKKVEDMKKRVESSRFGREAAEKTLKSLENQMYFLEEEVREAAEEDASAPGFTDTTGLLRLNIRSVSVNPVFECNSIEFFVDEKLIHTIKPDFVGVLEFSLQNSRSFEVIMHGHDLMVFSLVFCPVFNFVKYRGDFEVRMRLQNSQINAIIEFIRDVKINKGRAQILRIIRCGHVLKSFSKVAPYYCGVCSSLINFFVPAYQCGLCEFICHKKCANYILFRCARARKEREAYHKGYTIDHWLEDKRSMGLTWCAHCGARIEAAAKMSSCKKCHISVHPKCQPVLFKSCGIELQYRQALCDFKPAPPKFRMPLSTVTLNEFKLIKTVGRGAFGKIILAKHIDHDKIVALKVLKKQDLFESDELAFIDLERQMLAFTTRENHPFLMRMEYCFYDASNLFFGMEFMAGGDLYYHLCKEPFDHERIRLYAAEILLAIGFFHSKRIVYRDLKLDNVMIAQDGHIKVVDYGLCKDNLGPFDLTHTYCGTPDTTAPEVIAADGYTKDCDWWSYGVVLFELYELESPFTGSSTEEISAQILNKKIEFTNKTPAEAQQLISALLVRDPKERLGKGEEDYKQIQKHPYFKDMDWEKVYNKEYIPSWIPPSAVDKNFDSQFTENDVLLSPAPAREDLDYYFVRFFTD